MNYTIHPLSALVRYIVQHWNDAMTYLAGQSCRLHLSTDVGAASAGHSEVSTSVTAPPSV